MRRSSRLPRWTGLATIGLCAVLMMLGCSHASPLTKTQAAYRAGDPVKTRQLMDKLVSRHGEGSMAVIAWLEAGSILQTFGQFEASNEALTRALDLMEEYDQKADVRLGQEMKALLTHQGLLAYEGKPHERILAHMMRAQNNMVLRDWEAVRTDIIAAHFAQQEAVRINEKRIERAQKEIEAAKQEDEKNSGAYDLEMAQADERFTSSYSEHYGHLDNYQGYTNYVNPYVEWLSSMYYLSAPRDAGDIEQARFGFERVLGMVPDNQYLHADMNDAHEALRSGLAKPTTWVVFATGTAPSRSTIRIDLPVILVTNKVDYVGAAFPRLVFHDSYDRTLLVRGDEETETSTAPICDVDQIIAQDFKNELPAIIAKTLFATAVKAAIAYAINQATKSNNYMNIAARVGTAAYQISQNQADLRTWATLPKQYQVCRIPTPASGQLSLVTSSGIQTLIEVMPEKCNFVHVRSIHGGGALHFWSVPMGMPAPPPVSQVAMESGEN